MVRKRERVPQNWAQALFYIRESFLAGCLFTLTFMFLLFVLPVIMEIRAGDAAEKKHANEEVAEPSDAANRR